jgi:GTP-binding protein HflX
LPHQLVESFKSTFEEVADADLLIHVVDSTHPDRERQIQTVLSVLEELKLAHKPIVTVFNKIDKGAESIIDQEVLLPIQGPMCRASGLTGLGVFEVLKKIEEVLSHSRGQQMTYLIPHNQGKILNDLYTNGQVIEVETLDEGIKVKVALPEKWRNLYQEYVL